MRVLWGCMLEAECEVVGKHADVGPGEVSFCDGLEMCMKQFWSLFGEVCLVRLKWIEMKKVQPVLRAEVGMEIYSQTDYG